MDGNLSTVCVHTKSIHFFQSSSRNRSDNRPLLEGQVVLDDYFSRMEYISIYSRTNGKDPRERDLL